MSVYDLPDYHFKPFVLTNSQIKNPTSVILDFFINFHLPDIREDLKKMYEDSLHKETLDPQTHYHTFSEIQKLVEACWVLREAIRQNNETGFGTITSSQEKHSKPPTLWLPLNPHLAPTNNSDNKAAAGTVTSLNGQPGLVVDRINAPLFGHIDGVVEVNGDSMVPTFVNGCRVGIVRLKDSEILNWGACYYIIDKNGCTMVRRVYPGETADQLRFVADHPDQELFPPVIRLWDQIETIYGIKITIIKQ